MDNDLLPNDGEYYAAAEPFAPTEPEAQTRERALERSKATAALPLIQDLITRWQTRADFYDSIESIQASITDEPELFQRIHAANSVIKQGFEQEVEYQKQLSDTYK